MGPRGALLIMVLLIVSERNSPQVRLGKIRAILEGIQRPQETRTGTSPGLCLLSASACQHHFLLLQTDFYLPGNVFAAALLCLPLIVFQKVSQKDSD